MSTSHGRMRLVALLVSAGAVAAPMGCENLPGTHREQGAVAGGAGGAVLGAVIAHDNPLLGALIGGAAGAVGGYLIGANWNHITGKDKDQAVAAAQKAQASPATADQARAATTADINGDGFVTLDEVVAMKKAGFADDEMIRRLQATNQIFELTQEQQQYLTQNGVSQNVINAMLNMNRDQKQQLIQQQQAEGGDVVGRPK